MASLTERLRAAAAKEKEKEKQGVTNKTTAKTGSLTERLRAAAAKEQGGTTKTESKTEPTTKKESTTKAVDSLWERGSGKRPYTTAASEAMWDRFDGTKRRYFSLDEDYDIYDIEEYESWRGSVRDAEAVEAELSRVNNSIGNLTAEQKLITQSLNNSYANNIYVSGSRQLADHERITELDAQIKKLREQQALLNEELSYAKGFDYAALSENADFAARSAAEGSKRSFSLFQNTNDPSEVYDYINNIEGYGDTIRSKADVTKGVDLRTGFDSYDYMTEEQKATFNYIYNTQGEDAAAEYLKWASESLNYQFGQDIAAGIDSNLRRILYGVGAGVENFGTGIQSVFGKGTPTSATQYAAAQINEDLADVGPKVFGQSLGQTAFQTGQVIGNMAPSILVSTLTAGAGAPAALAGLAGSTAMGLSAGGNAYNQALAEGKSPAEARDYGIMIGAAEGGLQYLLGGIGKLGGAASAKTLAKISSIDNVLARIAATGAVKISSEVTEEVLQEYIEPALRTLIFEEEFEGPSFEDIAYTMLVTALSTGLLEGGSIISESRAKPNEAPNVPEIEQVEQAETLEQPITEEPIIEEKPVIEEEQIAAEEEPVISEEEAINEALHELAIEQQQEQSAAQESVAEEVTEAQPAKAEDETDIETKLADSGYGEAGKRTVENIAGKTGESVENVIKQVNSAYQAGLTDLPKAMAPLETAEQEAAFDAGKIDHVLSLGQNKETAETPADTVLPAEKTGLPYDVQVERLSTPEKIAENVENTAAQEYTASENAAKKTFVPAKKADWPAHDVEYYVPGKKRAVAYSTVAARDTLGAVADANADATISELKQHISYDAEAKRVLDAYIANGYGDSKAIDFFSYDRDHGYTKTAKKEDTDHVEEKETVGGGNPEESGRGVRPGETGDGGSRASEGRGSGLRDGSSPVDVAESGKGRGQRGLQGESGDGAALSVDDVRDTGELSEIQEEAGSDRTGEREHSVLLSEEAAAEETAEQTIEKTAEEEIKQKDELGNQEQPKGVNFIIPEKGLSLPNGEKSRFKANVEAIKTLRKIMSAGRVATPEEQIILSKYVGWGGLANAFDDTKSEWAKEYKQLKGLLDDAEYASAKGSTLNAHYTSVEVIRSIYKGLAGIGFEGGRLLEPSAGVGHFAGAMPQGETNRPTRWTMVELDKITGNIAKYLYPNADVRVQGFEAANIPDNYMDAAISNVPFGNYAIADKSYPKAVTGAIHNYFFAKALDKVRPGGIVCFITSRYTMDASNSGIREYISKRADLIGAIRLPDSAFKGNAGTEVVTDILVLKKRQPNTPYAGADFIKSDYGYIGGTYEATNEYFKQHPEMVLGEPSSTGSMYRGNSLTYTAKPGNLGKQIEKAFSNITERMEYPARRTQEEIRAEIKRDAGKVKEGGIVRKDGKLYQNINGSLEEVSLKPADEKRMTGIVEIRDAARALLDMQLDDAGEKAIAKQRKLLNQLYDKYVADNGTLSARANARLVKMDADDSFIRSLEYTDKKTGKTVKAAIFSKNTVTPNRTVTHADSIPDALNVVMNESGTVDINRIAQLTGETTENVRRELLESRAVFKNRNGDLEIAETYLSGNVKAKLRDAEALAEADSDYKANVEELRKIIPADIAPEDISVRPGATWIPDSTYSTFASEMLGGGMTYDRRRGQIPSVEVVYNKLTSSYTVTLNDDWLKYRAENTSEWGTSDRSFANIFEAMLNSKNISVWRKTSDGSRYLDKQATAQVAEKREKILAEFQKWVWADETRKTELGKLYNDIFNNSVTPKYDGSNLTVNGLNAAFSLRSHQANAVHRIVASGGNTLLAHKVGAGKTLEMAAAAMKLRQLGLVKKPVFVVPKSLAPQWANEFQEYFPNAKVLFPDEKDFGKDRRKTLANRVATGDWDAVILSVEQFKKIEMSQEHQEAFYQDQITALELAIREAGRAKGKDPSVKNMERSKKSLEAKLKTLTNRMSKDTDNITFEQMGIDALFVDEAHQYKNLFFTTKMQNISGLSNKDGSQQALDLYMKVRYLQQLNGGRGVVFATATPVMNSMSEMYIMQRYLQGDLLEAKGLDSFDAWANQFGEVRTVLEMNPSGKGYRQKQSFSRFKNLAELQQMFRGFADVVTDLPLKLPKLKDGKRTIVECEPSEFQMEYIDELAARADAIKDRKVDPKEDNMLKITSDGRKLSYTQRMIDPTLPYETEGKIVKCADNVVSIYKEYDEHKAAQLVFCDLSTPKGSSNSEKQTEEVEDVQPISIYDDLRSMLIARGIPAKEIAFIHDADTPEKKTKLFDDVNAGNVRVLIGSTGKMGVGMNAQERMIAMHHLDAPWRPGDIEQREGRMIRQKNMFADLDIPVQSLVYITKKTFDSRMWDNLERKAAFINQVMAGDLTAREAEGDGDFALSAAEIKAIASGNPLIMEQFEVAADLQRLVSLERAHAKEVSEASRKAMKLKQEIAADEMKLPMYKADAAKAQDTSGDKFTMQIGGKDITERKAAGEALIAEAKKVFKAGEIVESITNIGKFAGFDLAVTNTGDMVLRGVAQYRGTVNMASPMGTITILENVAARPAKAVAATEKRINEAKANVKKLEAVAASPFDKAAELAEKRLRNAEILAELNPEEDQNVAELDSDGEESMLVDAEQLTETVAQEISSAKTSIKQIPALFKDKNVTFGKVNIDIGGGKYDLATDYLKSIGTLNLVFDPYNRSEAVNSDTLDYLRGGHKADTATCANVLNVIAEPQARDNVILEMAKSIKPDGRAYFMVYEGDGSGVGRETSAGWQNNRKTRDYMDEIRKYFSDVRRQGKLITATQPKANLPKASWEIAPGKGIRYSKDQSGLQSRPENWTAKRVGEAKETKSVSEIIAGIEHDFGFNVTAGHVRGKGVRGTFNTRDKGIRTKITNDLPTAAHELGHALDDRYGLISDNLSEEIQTELKTALGENAELYDEDEHASEGFAEYLRQYLQDSETATISYPETTQYFLSSISPKDRVLIQQLADEVNAYYALDADSAASSIRLREEGPVDLRTKDEKLRDMGDDFYQAFVDSNHGIKLFDEAVGSDVYKLASNSAYSSSIAAQIITGDLTDPNGQYVGPGLKTALHGINTQDKREYRAFGEYLVVRHGPEYLAKEKRVFADDRKNNAAWMQKRQMDLEAQYPQFEAAAERLYEFIDALNRTWGVECGLIEESLLDEWRENEPNYIPMYRAMEIVGGRRGARRGFANQSSPYKRAKGSGRDIINGVDNVIDQIVLLVNTGVRNRVMLELRNAALNLAADASFMEKVPTPMVPKNFDMRGVKAQLSEQIEGSDMTENAKSEAEEIIEQLADVMTQFNRGKAHGDVVTVMVNGKPEFWKINDTYLLESVTNMTPVQRNGILDLYAKTTRFITANATGNNPIWSIFSNVPRDFMTFLYYSKDTNRFKGIGNLGKAYINAFKEKTEKEVSPFYAEYIALGARYTSMYSADTNLAKKARKQLTQTKAQKWLGKINPIEWVTLISDTVEMGPRFAMYKMMRENGLSEQEAFYEAMDVTTNFRRSGTKSREINKVVPFFNASVQGIDKLARFYSAEDVSKSKRAKAVASRAAGMVTSSIALAALSYFFNNFDDDREKEYEQLSNYTKNSFWCIPLGDGRYFTIPKPRDLAVMSSFFETCMERFIGGNKHAFDEFADYASDNLLPALVSDLLMMPVNMVREGSSQGIKDTFADVMGSMGLIGIVANWVSNRDFLGKPIESATLQTYEARDRFNDNTSKMAYWLGQAFDLSPVMVDYLAKQFLGYIWKMPAALMPMNGKADWTFGVKSTYNKDNQYSQDLVNWLYDQKDKSALAAKSDQTDMDKAITAKMDNNMTTFYSRFNALNKGKPDTERNRHTRQTMLDIITEYRKFSDSGEFTAAQKEVYGIVEDVGETSYLPAVMTTTVTDAAGKVHNLSDAQYIDFQTDYLNQYWSYIEDRITYGMSSQDKIVVIRAAKEIAKSTATNNVLSRIGGKLPEVTDYTSVDYGKTINTLRDSSLWNSASDTQRASVEEQLYNLTIMNTTGENMMEDIEAGAAFGVDTTDYLLYELALEIHDKPNKSGKLGGTPTGAEKAAALSSMKGLSDSEIAYFWDTEDGYEAFASGVDMRAYVDYIGDGGSVSLEKLVGAQDAGIDNETYYAFLDMLKEVDTPTDSGKYGSFTQAEAKAAVAAMEGLTKEQRAHLWQSVNSGWKSYNNPWK